jgi:hypothetical protein
MEPIHESGVAVWAFVSRFGFLHASEVLYLKFNSPVCSPCGQQNSVTRPVIGHVQKTNI